MASVRTENKIVSQGGYQMRKSQEDGGFAKKVSGSRAGHGDSTTTGMRHNNGIGQNTLSAPAHGVSVPDRRNHQTSHGTSWHY